MHCRTPEQSLDLLCQVSGASVHRWCAVWGSGWRAGTCSVAALGLWAGLGRPEHTGPPGGAAPPWPGLSVPDAAIFLQVQIHV